MGGGKAINKQLTEDNKHNIKCQEDIRKKKNTTAERIQNVKEKGNYHTGG